MTRASGRLKLWLLDKSVDKNLSEIKLLINQLIFLRFRHLHSISRDQEPEIPFSLYSRGMPLVAHGLISWSWIDVTRSHSYFANSALQNGKMEKLQTFCWNGMFSNTRFHNIM